MRGFKSLMNSLGVALGTAAMVFVAPLAAMQDAPIKVDVKTEPTHTVWYADPMWLGVGAVAVVLIIVLAIMASRGRDGGTTVVR